MLTPTFYQLLIILQNRHTYAQSQSYWFVTLWCDCPRVESFSTNLKQCHWNSDKRTFRFNTISITKFWEPDDWLPFVFTEEEFRGGTIGRINELEDSHRTHELAVSSDLKIWYQNLDDNAKVSAYLTSVTCIHRWPLAKTVHTLCSPICVVVWCEWTATKSWNL